MVLIGLLHAARYRGHVSDDAFIAFRYAWRLAHGHGLTWTEGSTVEGYSDLLWVLALACGEALGWSAVVPSRVLGLGGFVASILLIARGDGRRAWTGGLALALSGGMAAWSVGGLEHTVMTGLLLALLTVRARWGAWLALPLTWIRADGAVHALGVALVERRRGVAALAALGAAAQLLLRLWLHGDWLPNTARVKVSFSVGRTVQGFTWLAEVVLHNGVLVGAALFAAWTCRDARRPVWVAALLALYQAAIGGDGFYGYRLALPVLGLLALAWAEAGRRVPARIAVGVGLLYGLSHLYLTPVRTLAQPGWALRARAPAEALRVAFGARDPLLATDAAGVLPYVTRFRSLDMLGLNDRYLALHPPPDWGGAARLGHDLGDGRYVAAQRPDLVAFCSALGSLRPCFRSGREWVDLPDWTYYRPLWLEVDGIRAIYHLRVDGALGVERSPDEVRVPAALLSSPERPARVEGGHLVVELRAGDAIPSFRPPGEGWTVEGAFQDAGDELVALERHTLRSLRWVRR